MAPVDPNDYWQVPPRPWINPTPTTPPASAPTHRTRQARQYSFTSALGQPIDVPLGPFQQTKNDIIFAGSYANDTIAYLSVLIGEGPIEALTPRYDAKDMTLVSGNHWSDPTGLLQCWVYDGTQTTLDASNGLAALDPSRYDDREIHHGIAHVLWRIQFDTNNMNTVPTFTYRGKGNKAILDVRTGTRIYTENDALIIREVISNETWGIRVPNTVDNFDDSRVTEGGFGFAADICDEHIFPPTPVLPPVLSINHSATGDPIAPGVYSYTYTCLNGNGVETVESPAATILVTAPSTVSVALPSGGANTRTRRVYRTAIGGSLHYFVGDDAFDYFHNSDGFSVIDVTANSTAITRPNPPQSAPPPERYRMGGLLSRQASGDDWLNTFRAHCMGVITQDNGRYQLRIERKLPAGYQRARFSTKWTGGNPPNVDPATVRRGRKKREQMFNQVVLYYTDTNNEYASDFVTVSRPEVDAGIAIPVPTTYHCEFALDRSTAVRLATTLLNVAWADWMVDFRANRSAIGALPGDVIAFTGAGVADQDVRLQSIATAGDDFDLMGIEYDDAFFLDEVVNEDNIVKNILPDPDATPAQPTNCEVRETIVDGPNGKKISKLIIEFTPASIFYRATRVIVFDGIDTRTYEQPAGPIEVSNPRINAQHTIKLYTINKWSRVSVPVILTITPRFLTSDVPDVRGIIMPYQHESDRGKVTLVPPIDTSEVDHYEVFDNFGQPAVPPLVRSVPPNLANHALDLSTAIHGDGYTTDMVLSLLVKVVAQGNPPRSSPGLAVSWVVPANGTASYQAGYDPRDIIFVPPEYDGVNGGIWESNFGGGDVWRYDPVTGVKTFAFNVGANPYGITFYPVSPTLGYLIVANFGSDSITAREIFTGVISTLACPAGSGPMMAIAEPASGHAFVTFHKSGKVRELDGTGSTVADYNVGLLPCFAYAMNGKVFVCNYGSNTVSVIQPGVGVVGTINVGAGPFGLAADLSASPNLWIANYSDSTLSRVDVATLKVIDTISLGFQSGPTDVAATPDGYVWVSCALSRELVRVNVISGRVAGNIVKESSPRSIVYTGVDLWCPQNTNAVSSIVPVAVENPAPGGGRSNAIDFTVVGLDPSPLPH
jgi:YVTN family beta-propeller protein